MKDTIKIRPVNTIEEYRDCEAIQKQVWQFADREIVPINELITIQRTGGLVLGAFLGRKQVGFAFGFAGLQDGRLIHSSRMLAVLPGYRNYDIGYRLKLAQRAFALKQGVKLATWTFDPLQSLNAFFNIVKLGVIVRRYFVNLYGMSSSVLNKGVPTDRFLAEWAIDSRRVKERLAHKLNPKFSHGDTETTEATNKFNKGLGVLCPFDGRPGGSASVANSVRCNKNGLVVSAPGRLNLQTPAIAVAIPYDFNAILHKDNNLAIDWRLKTRRIFSHYFKKGYEAVDFLSPRSDAEVSPLAPMLTSGAPRIPTGHRDARGHERPTVPPRRDCGRSAPYPLAASGRRPQEKPGSSFYILRKR